MSEQEDAVTIRDKIVGVFFDTDFELMKILDNGSDRGSKLFKALEDMFYEEISLIKGNSEEGI